VLGHSSITTTGDICIGLGTSTGFMRLGAHRRGPEVVLAARTINPRLKRNPFVTTVESSASRSSKGNIDDLHRTDAAR
jgi:hypothetical protein